MRRMIAALAATALATTSLVGCGTSTVRMRFSGPEGAILRVLERDREVEIAAPLLVEIEALGGAERYPVEIVVPREVATRYGSSRSLDLVGTLTVMSLSSRAGRDALVSIEIAEGQLRQLLRGETDAIAITVPDPAAPRQDVLRLELRNR